MEASFQHSNCWSTWKKRWIPQAAGCYHVWVAHITQAIRGSSKRTIMKLCWIIRKKMAPERWHAHGENYSALTWSQGKPSWIWSGFVLIERSLLYGHNFLNFQLGQPEILLWFANRNILHTLIFPRLQLMLIKLYFMHLYQADIWHKGGMNRVSVAKLEEKHQWTGR